MTSNTKESHLVRFIFQLSWTFKLRELKRKQILQKMEALRKRTRNMRKLIDKMLKRRMRIGTRSARPSECCVSR